jgi:hypothetical protein
LFGLFLCAAAPTVRAATVLAPHTSVAGKTLEEWSAAWWQRATEIPVADSPLFDETGAKAAAGDAGQVFFLFGKFTNNSAPSATPVTATRSATVKDNQYLFFPILNVIGADQPIETSRTMNADSVASYTELHASIDGEAVANLFDHREISPVFTITLPAGDVFGAGPATFNDAAADGMYLMVAPLSAGEHTINFGGAQGKPDTTFALDITYNLTVEHATAAIPLPAGAWAGLMCLPLTLAATRLAGKSKPRR